MLCIERGLAIAYLGRHVLASAYPLPAAFIEPCLPTSAKRPHSGKGRLHEIKHDGFRFIARNKATGCGSGNDLRPLIGQPHN